MAFRHRKRFMFILVALALVCQLADQRVAGMQSPLVPTFPGMPRDDGHLFPVAARYAMCPFPRFLKGGKVLTTVRQRIKWITVAIEPEHLLWVSKEGFVYLTRCGASCAKPASNKIEDAADVGGMQSRVDNTQNAAARLSANDDLV
ncbi:MAG TPA: hypothetical protein VFU22_19400, partial [Roseiflexaceae bacterium]|nr:hypothetical protein [Roseiflexaceae bacterium]